MSGALFCLREPKEADYKQLFTVIYFNKELKEAHSFIQMALNQCFPEQRHAGCILYTQLTW